ncbi:unnamed protein product [Arctia plantaginis]|uniref:Uncharacterized protein n=1 Tax=Arctia plantaginis TaxID=874455 RepID=A0A8S1AHN8_ARCPL|nr:unnamed protein product [Arctia plantaginis]
MAFVFKVLFVSALAYSTHAGYLSGHHSSHDSHYSHHDSFLSSALQSPSASFGSPSHTYGVPASSQIHHHSSGPGVSVEETVVNDDGPVLAGASLPGSSYPGLYDNSNGYGNGGISSGPGSSYGVPSQSGVSGPGLINGPGLGLPSSDYSAPSTSGGPYSEGSLLLDSTLPGSGGQVVGNTIGAPRVIGTTVSVGRPQASATRYELQSVVQNVVRRIPVEVVRHIQVAVPHPVPVPVREEVKVPVPQPYPVHVDVIKHVPYPVYKTKHVEVERPVPYEVVKQVPVEVIRKVHVPVDRPYEVIKKIHVPVEKHVEVPVAVWKPYPVHVIKHVTHYKKKSCCW